MGSFKPSPSFSLEENQEEKLLAVFHELLRRGPWFSLPFHLPLFLFGPPKKEPLMAVFCGLFSRGALRHSYGQETLVLLAEKSTWHGLEVLAASRLPELSPLLQGRIQEKKRLAAVLDLVEHQVLHDLKDFQVALLKGAATKRLYKESYERQRNDVDLLVGPQLKEVRARLLALHWEDHVTPKHYDQGLEQLRAWPMKKRFGPYVLTVDLQAHLGADWCLADEKKVRESAKNAMPSDEDLYLTTLIHLVRSGFHEPLKGWIDLLYLSRRLSGKVLLERAREFGMMEELWLSKRILKRWFHEGEGLLCDPILAPKRRLLSYFSEGQHKNFERQEIYKGFSQRYWKLLLAHKEKEASLFSMMRLGD